MHRGIMGEGYLVVAAFILFSLFLISPNNSPQWLFSILGSITFMFVQLLAFLVTAVLEFTATIFTLGPASILVTAVVAAVILLGS